VAETFQVATESLSAEPDLNEVLLQLDGSIKRGKKLYSAIKRFMKELTEDRKTLPIPEPLLQLASVTNFELFVSTSFDPFLRLALDQVRFGGEARTESLAYSTVSDVPDLARGMQALENPLVYQIFGEVSYLPGDYAVSEEDALEFLHQLRSERRPATLFDELRENHLLFLGCGFPDWLALSLIRTLSDHPLLQQRPEAEFIADLATQGDPRFQSFMTECEANLYPTGDPVVFVATLAERWKERHPDAGPESPGPVEVGLSAKPQAESTGSEKMEPGAIFVSYASEDRPAAQNLCDALERAGLQVWFDRKDLEAGDAWESSLERNIERCSLFIPLLSKHAQERVEGVFRAEWDQAIKRSKRIAKGVPFILPIVVDDLENEAGGIDQELWRLQVSRFEKGLSSEQFVERAKQSVRTHRLGRR
jgi:hypothetical protein